MSPATPRHVRPRTVAHGHYFKLPYSYWAAGYDLTLTQPEKLMLLIGLDQPDGFKLPFNQAKAWYGVSENTARRGFRGLADHGLVAAESTHEPSAKSPTGWAEIIRYTMTGPFSRKAIAKAVKSRGKTVFTTKEPKR